MLIFVIAPLALLLLALITWIALSKKSSPPVRRAAIVALVLIGLSVIASLALIFSGPAAVLGRFAADLPQEPVQLRKEGSVSILIFMIFLLAFLGLIIFLALRRERQAPKSRP